MEPMVIHSAGASTEEMLADVPRGGRFVVYRWAVGFLLVFIAQWSKITWIPPGQDPRIPGIGCTILTVTLGLWSPLAWPEVFTALRNNLNGGCDVTDETVRYLEALLEDRGTPSEPTTVDEPDTPPTDEPDHATPGIPEVDTRGLAARIEDTQGTLVVLFSAPWCGPAKALAPALHSWAEQRTTRTEAVMVDIERSPALASQHRVHRIPALLVFNHGRLHAMLTHPKPGDLLAALDRAVLVSED